MKNLTTRTLTTALIALISIAVTINKAAAQSSLNNKLKCNFSIPVAETVTDQQAYEIAAEWFGKNATEFTRSNISQAAQCAQCTNASSMAEVNHEFKNTEPVQSLDPASNRISLRVVTKYYGATGGNIHALYLQYYMIVTVADHKINCQITDMHYNHFNEHNYQFKRIQNWSNSTSLDPVNTLDYLIANEQSHEEFNKFYSFLNSDVNQIMAHFGNFVNGTLSQN